MGIQKTLGGNRLGSGNRMKQEMHDFYRSNKNLSKTWGSTMAAGVLYPCYVNIALKGDTFDIDANAFVRTIPTIGPLYGSFKLQVDFFQVPIRLYQAILHNNTTDISRKMNQVFLPKIELPAVVEKGEVTNGFKTQINESSLMRYLRQSGVLTPLNENDIHGGKVELYREVLAVPLLSYYDIFKNYYSNKQEENAYVITPNIVAKRNSILSASAWWGNSQFYLDDESTNDKYDFAGQEPGIITKIAINGQLHDFNNVTISFGQYDMPGISNSLQKWLESGILTLTTFNPDLIICTINSSSFNKIIIEAPIVEEKNEIALTPFPLSNIDDMRKYLLTQWDLGTKVVLSRNNQNYLPYSINSKIEKNGKPSITYPLVGLCVKTYQSDMFNNWLDSEWVNEITETSAIDVSNGSFTLDMLNFKKKLYDHLNRLAISGGTYDDWQEATYGDKVWGKSEKPIYCGGMASEIEFDEVVSTAASGDDVLGTIGGRGTLNGKRGGHITIKVGEASVIMGIVSITPRIMYNQGNAWFNTELDTMDDLHKPIFDRIGFQDLMVEQMAWWDAKVTSGQGNHENKIMMHDIIRTSAGKQPAWLQYATDVDEVYGDFAKDYNGVNYMVLTRRYEQNNKGMVSDVTTYIDPQKYNYAFAYQNLDAQNFWTFIRMKIHARRKMSNTQIPNV